MMVGQAILPAAGFQPALKGCASSSANRSVYKKAGQEALLTENQESPDLVTRASGLRKGIAARPVRVGRVQPARPLKAGGSLKGRPTR
jgi:hypothetical protein